MSGPSEETPSPAPLLLDERFLEALAAALSQFIAAGDSGAFFARTVADAVERTGSGYGFIAGLRRNDAGAPDVELLASANLAWSDAVRRFYEETVAVAGDLGELRARFRDVRVSGARLIAQDPHTGGSVSGLPPGHPPLRSMLCLPLRSQGAAAGIVCLGNREGGYEDRVAGVLAPLVASLEAVLGSLRAQESRRREEAAARAARGHEIRTAMAAIVGYCDMLVRSTGPDSAKPHAVRQIRANCQHMLGLLDDVLAPRSGEAERAAPPGSQATPVAAWVTGLLPELRQAAADRGLTLDATFAGPVPASWRTDPARVRQVLLEMVGFAAHGAGHGVVTMRTSFRPPAVPAGSGRLLFQVEGMGTAIGLGGRGGRSGAFTQVYDLRGTQETTTPYDLAATKRLTAALGGELQVVDSTGAGRSVSVELPVAPEDCLRLDTQPQGPSRAARPTRPGAEPRLDGRRILVVDDDEDNRRIARFLLEDAGADVQTADDGQAGIEAFEAASRGGRGFDAILMDMQMPVCDGFSATSQLRSRGVTVPIIAVTALALAEDAARCLAAGCSAYLTKPIVPEEILATLDGLLSVTRTEVRPVNRRATAEERFAALVTTYVGQFAGWAREIRVARDCGDLAALRTLVHRMRGTGTTFGFPGLTRHASAIEDALRAGTPPEQLAEPIELLLKAMEDASA